MSAMGNISSQFQFFMEHVSGADNVFAHVLTRWIKGFLSDNRHSQNKCELVYNEKHITPSTSEIQ